MLSPRIKEGVVVLIIVILFVFVRMINYPLHLNFSHDQGLFSQESLEIWRERKLILLGPPTSINFDGRYIFQGSIIYYFNLVFLLLGSFDPVSSSVAFTIFSGLMLIFLYYGSKMLSNRKAAFLIVGIYAFLPYFVEYTRFLWNPNFQLSLLPLLVFCMGLYKKRGTSSLAMGVGIIMGLLMMFHYQFILVTSLVIAYYFFIEKVRPQAIATIMLGFAIGFLPLIIFEVRNNFYNVSTAIFIFTKGSTGQPDFGEIGHYYSSVSLMVLVLLLTRVKINQKFQRLSIALIPVLFLWSLYLNTPTPQSGFRMAPNWNYPKEKEVHNIIAKEGKLNFNVTNLIYDTKAEVQKYLFKNDGVQQDLNNYSTNEYLYVIATTDKDIFNDQAYEVRDFFPATLLKTWDIGQYHKLYLLQRS